LFEIRSYPVYHNDGLSLMGLMAKSASWEYHRPQAGTNRRDPDVHRAPRAAM